MSERIGEIDVVLYHIDVIKDRLGRVVEETVVDSGTDVLNWDDSIRWVTHVSDRTYASEECWEFFHGGVILYLYRVVSRSMSLKSEAARGVRE